MSSLSRSRLMVLMAVSLTTAIALTAFAASTTSAPAQTESDKSSQLSPGVREFLRTVSNAPRATLAETLSLRPAVVDKVMAHREAGGAFKSLGEFRTVTGIDDQMLLKVLEMYQAAKAEPAERKRLKPVPEPPGGGGPTATPSKRSPIRTPSPPESAPAPTEEGPITNVRPGYYAKLPGYPDLEKIHPLQKKAFLETVNREMCGCGCQNETLAFCLVNDPGCPVVKARVKKIYDDIMKDSK